MANLMEQARAQRGDEQQGQQQSGAAAAPDWRQFTPPELQDPVERIVAAGAKLMYSPEMRQELQQAVSAEGPVDQKLADNVVGLMLTLDQKSQGGLPVAALFPAGLGLLGEAAQVLQAAGQQVTQEDFNNAAVRMYVVMGKKLGGTDDQIMQGVQQAMGGAAPAGQQPEAEDAGEPGEQPEGTPADATEDRAEGEPPETEEQAMARGMQ